MPGKHPLYLLPRYLKVTGNNYEKLQTIFDENKILFIEAQGSQHNHQAWPGGYLQHLVDAITIAQHIYNIGWKMPFTWSSVVLVLFLRNIEKPFMQQRMADDSEMPVWNKAQKAMFRGEVIAKYNIHLTAEEITALLYFEGEGDDYSPTERKMNELGALCHAADILSARLWHSKNKPETAKSI